jgi:molybdopterin molybdotransferase
VTKTLLPVSEALARILDGVAPTGPETVPLLDALGRVLADDVAAKLTQPPFAASAMDGYAVRAEDIASAPARLAVIGMSAAGRGFRGALRAGEAARIFTGAPLPEGADTVVIQESTQSDGDGVLIREGAAPGANVRGRGIDFEAGQILLRAGRALDAHALALAAAMGHGALPVRRKPVVAILATGDELVPPGTAPGPDQIVSANPIGLAALVAKAGGAPRLLGIARDTTESIAEKIGEARDADVLVTIGGASVGDHDLVAPALRARGMTLDFWKVAIRPGKPLLFGRLGSSRVLGLPGNPVSALICGHVFLKPLIRALLGLSEGDERTLSARLTHALEANGSRLHLMRATLARGAGGELAVTALPSQDSSLLSALAAADCLIVRAPGAPAKEAGSSVEIERLDL